MVSAIMKTALVQWNATAAGVLGIMLKELNSDHTVGTQAALAFNGYY